MRRILFDQQGNAAFYLTGAGVMFNILNQGVGIIQRELGLAIDAQLEPVTGSSGAIIAWFDDAFLWTTEGELIAFVKGAKPEADLLLPKTKKLAFKPEPKTTPFKPLLARAAPPERQWRWADGFALLNQETYFA